MVSRVIVESQLASNRARIYGILADIYSKPVGDSEIDVLRYWCETEIELPEKGLPDMIARGIGLVRAWIEEVNNSQSHDYLSELNTEFVQLFRGLSRHQSPPPPYESVYTDEGVLYGPSTAIVIKKYRQFNLRVQENEPPDHLALELDFMRFLCEREAQAWWLNLDVVRELLEEEYMFLDNHLALWVPALCQNIREFCKTRFYAGIADITEGWIRYDREIIAGLKNEKGKHFDLTSSLVVA